MSNFAGGSGTAEDPYLIENVEQMENIISDNYYKQISDIDLTGYNWTSIAEGDEIEDIHYNGNNNKIIGLNNSLIHRAVNNISFLNMNFVNCNMEMLFNEEGEATPTCILCNEISIYGDTELIIDNVNIYDSTLSWDNRIVVRPDGSQGRNDDYVAGFIGYLRLYDQSNVVVKNCEIDIKLQGEDVIGAWKCGVFGGFSLFNQSVLEIDNLNVECEMSVAFEDYSNPPSIIKDYQPPGGWGFNQSFNNGMYGMMYVYDDASVNIKNCRVKGNQLGETAMAMYGYIDQYGGSIEISKCSAHGEIHVIMIQREDTVGILSHFGQVCYWSSGLYAEVNNCYSRGRVIGYEDIRPWQASPFGGYESWGASRLVYKNCYAAVEWIGFNPDFNGDLDRSSYDLYGFLAPNLIPRNQQQYEVYNCYFDETLAPVGVDVLAHDGWKPPPNRSTGDMTHPPNWNTTYFEWDFENVWLINPTENDGYPYFDVGDIPFTPVPGGLLQFIEPPTVTRMPARASRVIVKSPEGEGMAQLPDISEDQIIERIIEIDKGGNSVCQQTAERLLESWKDEKINVKGDVRLVVGLSFKEKVKVFIEESNLNGVYLNVNSVEHDVINQTSRVNCGDIILDDAELLARILDD